MIDFWYFVSGVLFIVGAVIDWREYTHQRGDEDTGAFLWFVAGTAMMLVGLLLAGAAGVAQHVM